MFDVNFLAVLVAALANFFIGFMFHGPAFGKLWMKLANVTPTGNEKFSDMVPQMIWNFVSNVVFAFVLAMLYNVYSASSLGNWGAGAGMFVAFLSWIVIVASSSMEVIWMKRSCKLWAFELVSSLVSCLAMGAIIGAWMN